MNQNDVLSRVTNGDKALAGGSLVVLIALFLPWYGYDAGPVSASVSGFNSWGWLTFLGLLAVIAFWLIRNMFSDSVKLPDMPVTDGVAYMIGGAVEVLGAVIFWLAYHSDSLSGPGFSYGVRFGLFVAIVGGAITIAGGYLKQSEPATVAAAPTSSAPAAAPPAAAPPAAPPQQPSPYGSQPPGSPPPPPASV
jgi:hypothetical protein